MITKPWHIDNDSSFVKWPTEQTVVFAGEFISLRAISRKIGMHYSYLSLIFSGKRKPYIPTIQRIADCLEMPFERFMRGLEIHIEAYKDYGMNLPLLVPKEYAEKVDKQAYLDNNIEMDESYIVDNPTSQSIKFGATYINLSAIARARGLDGSYLSRVFSGERTPSIKHAKKIASTLGMSLEEFLNALDARISKLNRDKRNKAA